MKRRLVRGMAHGRQLHTAALAIALSACGEAARIGVSAVLAGRSDRRWGVTILAARANPENGCFGCEGSQVFPLAEEFREPERDSIWVVWGGNSISDPVIY